MKSSGPTHPKTARDQQFSEKGQAMAEEIQQPKASPDTDTKSRPSLEHAIGDAVRTARTAYCAYLPKLSSRDEVSEFIACIAFGMANGIILGAEGTRLLYAAQVAHSTLPSPKRRKKSRKTSQKQPPTPDTTPKLSTT
jgi:hypothetical protein